MEVPGPLDPLRVSCPTGRNYSGQAATCRNFSQLLGTPVALRDLPWVPITKDCQAYRHQAASFLPGGRFLQAGGTEGRPADLARSTAEGVGGYMLMGPESVQRQWDGHRTGVENGCTWHDLS